MNASAIFDLHVHYYTDHYLQAVENAPSISTYRRGDGRLVAKWRHGVALTVVNPHPGPEERIEMMDQVGISAQLLSVPSPNAYFVPPGDAELLARHVNEEFAAIVRAYPDRFAALAMLPLTDLDRAFSVLDEAASDLEMKGVMILSNIDGEPLDSDRLEPFWEKANEDSLLVYVHPTVPDAPHHDLNALSIAVGFFAETTLAIGRLAYSGIFARYPHIRWVFSHLGGTLPFLLPRLDSYWRQFEDCRQRCPQPPSEYVKGLLFDTASTHRPAIVCAADTLGLDRLVFGSDYPHVPGGSGPYLEALSVLGMDPKAYAELVGGRAQTLLRGEHI